MLLQEAGIKSMVPTDDLLRQLDGMTIHRFNQIMANDSKKELSLLEVGLLKQWLATLTHQQPDDIELLERQEAVAL
ncbi:hypothetical protein QMK33_19355 [Hymenobacter sp. H14-R3]|uniref:hypothetical protein n=1 Tax=Hymenobacter sp. H14-R3 TaxID=3046308 RepID=UPI0024BA1923|nr:hypothetical protein [Hymenobacter sp. H14-R3]MDJ0367311.1 hypothetical protein [Hymenobacter sp. H14-R3]